MIKSNDSRWKSESMTAKESFDEYYARKLRALKIELGDVIKSGLPYVAGAQYACRVCKCRILYHDDGRIYCLRCSMPILWSKETRACVTQILQRYPSLEQAMQEWDETHGQSRRQKVATVRAKDGNEELGKRIREARQALGWTQEELARKIYRKDGRKYAKTSIQGYETGYANPSVDVLKQLEEILGMRPST